MTMVCFSMSLAAYRPSPYRKKCVCVSPTYFNVY